MSEFSCDLGLSGYERERAAEQFATTYNLLFGGLERQTANYFRVDVSECVSQAPTAVVLRLMLEAVKSPGGMKVRLPHLSPGDRYKISEALQQTAARPGRSGRPDDDALGRSLMRLRTEWDRQHRLSAGELDRTEHIDIDAAQRESASVRRENARLKRAPIGA